MLRCTLCLSILGEVSPSIDWFFVKQVLMSAYHVTFAREDADVGSIRHPVNELKDAVFIKVYKRNDVRKEGRKQTFHHFLRITELCPSDKCFIQGYRNCENYYKQKYGINIKNKNEKLYETFSIGISAAPTPIHTSADQKYKNSKITATERKFLKNTESI